MDSADIMVFPGQTKPAGKKEMKCSDWKNCTSASTYTIQGRKGCSFFCSMRSTPKMPCLRARRTPETECALDAAAGVEE